MSDERFSAAHLKVRRLRRRALGAAIAAAREAAGMSQDALAELTHVSRPTISRLERGTGSISSDRLWDLAYHLGTTPAALFEAAQRVDGTRVTPK